MKRWQWFLYGKPEQRHPLMVRPWEWAVVATIFGVLALLVVLGVLPS